MSTQHLQLAKLALAGLSARDKQTLIRELSGQPEEMPPDKLIRPRAAADRLGVTTRTVFSLLRTGALTRVRLPGRTRALGIRNSEVESLIAGKN